MRCAPCGHENRAGRKFCVECGAALALACAACGAPHDAGEKFCGECGAAIAASGARGEPQAPGAQRARPTEAAGARKIVTIVFADLVGSTALHERLDPESAGVFMESYYRAMRAAVEGYGGTVTQLLGDGVKAVFGAPRVAEDDAIRAVRAAVEMQRAFHELAELQSGAVGKTGLRVAVNTGEVVANDATEIIGDPVNVAARLQEQGRDGDVVIGESTHRLVAALITLELLGSFALKGRAEPVKAYRVVSLDRPAGAAATAFVGRDDELARITAVYEAAIAAPAARLAVLLGSPGLGKSRLIDEFARRLGDAATVLAAQCEAAGGATFAPLAEALRELLHIEGGAAGDAPRAAVEAVFAARQLAAHPGDDAERARIAGGIAALLAGSPAPPEETFFVVRRLLAALATAKPVVLVIDDLHWAEPLLLDLVEHLVQWGNGVPLLVLVGARPELRDTRSSLATPGGLVAEVMTLAGLDAGAATRLAANVIGASDLPAAVAAKVLATSEGNPLFVGELVRMLVHEGALKREGDRWSVGVGLAGIEMPPTIHALLAARIERLRPEERSVLERAAVIGRYFSRNAVAELLPRDVTDLDARLESLRRSELIERDTGWFLGEPVLRFHHVLIRDAAYRRLLKNTRAELHGRFADWIEARAGGSFEHDETIGWHLEQAHQHLRELGPLDAQGRVLGERAARHLAAAGRRALARDDLALAAGLLGRALHRLDTEDPARADLALDWCEALLASGDVGPASAAIDELGRFIADSDRLRAWHTCFVGQLTALTSPQALHATADAVAAAADELAALGDTAGEAKAHFVHAQTFARLGKVGACEAALDRALAAARRADDRRRANTVLAVAPLAALWGPSPVTRASGRCLDVVRVLRITQGAPAVEAVALSCQGVLEALRGRTDAARRMIASARKMVEELGITHRLLEADVFAGRIDLLEGDAAAAERSLRGAYQGLRDLGLGIDAAQAAALLARALLALDRAAEAETLSHESEALAGDDLKAAIAWRGVRAEALARRGEHAGAIELAQAAVAIAAATDALLDHADARLALAAALRAAGRSSEADAEERRAGELWETKGATLLAEHARRNGGRVEPGGRDGEDPAEPGTRVAGDRAEPARSVRRRVRANAATANAARLDATVAARDIDAAADLLGVENEALHHESATSFGREGLLTALGQIIDARDLEFRHEALATLGASLGLFRETESFSMLDDEALGPFGAVERQRIVLIEVDESERQRRIEFFATERLDDAIARLYERYADLLPDGEARAHAAATARSIAALFAGAAAGDANRAATALSRAVELIDHRTLGLFSMRGADDALRAIRSLFDLADGVVFRQEILGLESSALLLRVIVTGTDRAGGGAFESASIALWVFGADGLIVRYESFNADREVEALARLDELTAAPHKPRGVRRRVRANAATAMTARFEAAFAARDDAALESLFSDSLEVIDYPTGSSYQRAGHLDSVRRLLRAQKPTLRIESLATLGESLCLSRRSVAASGTDGGRFDVAAWEREEPVLFEVDERGRARRIEIFAANQLGDGVARLYERYAEILPDGPVRSSAAATARSIVVALGPPDLDTTCANFAPGIELVDHRVLGFGSARGAGAMRQLLGAMFEIEIPVYRVDDVLALRADAILMLWSTLGTARTGGGAYHRQLLMLWVWDSEGLRTRIEYFDVDREAKALARFDEIVGSGDAEPAAETLATYFANDATRAVGRLSECWRAREWQRFAQVVSVHFHLSDRRRIAQLELDRDQFVEFTRQLGDMSSARREAEMLATRGDHLALIRNHVEVAGGEIGPSEIEFLTMAEADGHGSLVAFVRFDPENLDAAYAELDARYDAGEGAARAAASAANRALLRAFDARDADTVAELCAPTLYVEDHRSLGFGTLRGPAEYAQFVRSLFDLAPDVRLRIDHFRTSARGAVMAAMWLGTRDGGAFEISWIGVSELDDQGKILRLDFYGAEQLDQVRARFDATGAQVAHTTSAAQAGAVTPVATTTRFESTATRTVERVMAAFEARDWEGFGALFVPEFRNFDRRPLLQLETDREQWLASYRQIVEMTSSRPTRQVLATRGERLTLVRVCWRGEDGDVGPSELDWLLVIEVDDRGDHVAVVTFDPGDLDAAYVELDSRYEAGEGAAHPAHSTIIRAFTQAVVSRDWGPVVALCAPTLVEHDHRRLAVLGTTRGAEAWVQNFRTLVDLAPDTVCRFDHVRGGVRGFLWQVTWQGSREGGNYEIPLVGVLELDERDRIERADIYDLDQLDQLHARFEELATAAAPQPRFTNAATRTWEQVIACWAARDWQRFARLHAMGVRHSDRRRLMQLELDRDQFFEFTRQLGDMASSHIESVLLATRGERLALTRQRIDVADREIGPSEIHTLNLMETDDSGNVAEYVRFDLDDLDAAYAELEDRYDREVAAHEGAPVWIHVFNRAFAGRDWDALEAMYAPDLVANNHKLVGWGTLLGPARFLPALRSLVDLASDVRMRLDHLRKSDRGHLFEGAWVGTRDGGAFEIPLVGVAEQDAQGKQTRFDLYDPDQLEQARARFDAIGATTPTRESAGVERAANERSSSKQTAPDPLAALAKPNAATVAMERWRAAFDARDWEALRALFAPDGDFDDRRRLFLISGDAEWMVAALRDLAASADGIRPELQLLGAAGDRIDIERVLWSAGPPESRSEVEYLAVNEVDETGRITASISFDLDDRRAAQREAWARWVAVDTAATPLVRVLSEMIDAFSDHDRARYRAVLADDLIVEDHRHAGIGRLEGGDAYADSVAVLWEIAPAHRVDSGWLWAAYDRHGGVITLRRYGTLVDGGAFESDYLWLFTLARGRANRVEMFEIDAVDAALARFEELRPDPLRIPPNAATRARDRWGEAVLSPPRDWAAVRALVSYDFTYEDRGKRALVSGDVETWIASMQFNSSQPEFKCELELLGTLGDRIALERMVWKGGRDGDASETEHVWLFEVDAAGQVRAVILFDPDDRGAAFLEGLERFAAGEAAATGGQAPFVALIRAFLRHDWEGVREIAAPDWVLVDHRMLGLGTLDRDQWVASLQAQAELAFDLTVEGYRVLAWNRHGLVPLIRTFGTVPDGGPFENVFIVVALTADNHLRRHEVFGLDDANRAVAHFEELCAALDAEKPGS